MNVIIYPSVIHGNIAAAASKSSMQRALAAALLRKGRTIINNPGRSNDDIAALDTIQKLGAIVSHNDGQLAVYSNGVNPVSDTINCGESGLGIRMFTPIAALSTEEANDNGYRKFNHKADGFF